MEFFDLIILGAGAAGLGAASKLSHLGKRILVIEARDRVGGRVLSRNIAGCPLPLELGAEFIHGEPKETLELVQRFKLPIYDVTGEHHAQSGKKWPRMEDRWEQMGLILSKLGKNLKEDRTFADFLTAHKRIAKEQRLFIEKFVEGFHAAEISKIGEKGLAAATDGDDVERAMRFLSGYSSLLENLAKGVEAGGATIRLNTPVERVRWEKGKLEISAKNFTAAAKAALITLPVGVLKSGAVEFTPHLPNSKIAALSRIEMGSAHRVSFWFNENLLSEELRHASFLHSNQPFPTWWTGMPMHTPILVGWAGGGQALRLDVQSEEDGIEKAKRSLAKLLKISRAKIEKSCSAAAFHNWSADPFSRGAYTYLGVGGMGAPQALAKPIDTTLFFAGEATAPQGRIGTVDGALASGYRATKEILPVLLR